MTTTMDGETPATGGAPAERLRVLLVDDNASVLRFLASAFSSNGCPVTPAATAEQALEQLSDDPYDLVVSDIKMPGLSGLDLLRAVKGKQPDTPVVLITGVPSVNSAVFGLRHGAYDYLPKPFSVTRSAGAGPPPPSRPRRRQRQRQLSRGTRRRSSRGGSPAWRRSSGSASWPCRVSNRAPSWSRCSSTRCRASAATAPSCCCATRAGIQREPEGRAVAGRPAPDAPARLVR